MTTTPPAAGAPSPASLTPGDEAAQAIEQELALVFASGDRVAVACERLRAAGAWSDADQAARLLRLVPAALRRAGSSREPLLSLLLDAAREVREPWPLVEGLLATRDQALCTQVLDLALDLARAGRLAVGAARLARVAVLVERDASPLATTTCLDRIARLVSLCSPDGPPTPAPQTRLLLDRDHPPLRRLAARLLDASGRRPARSVVGAVLGDAAASLEPLIVYTRGGHLDLVDLVREPGGPSPLAAALPAVVDRCGATVARDLIGELGWRRVNLGLTARPVVGVSVDDSLPLLLSPVEARVLSPLPGTRRQFECTLAVAHGGPLGEAVAGPAADTTVTRFRAYNLAHAEVLGELLDIAPLTVERIETLLAKMRHLVEEFVALFASRADECQSLPARYDALEARIRRELAVASPVRPCSLELTRLVQMFEDPPTLADVETLHGLKRYLHQRGLALGFGLLESSQGTNRTVDLALASPERGVEVVRCLEYVDFDPPAPIPGAPVAVPYPVAIVADGFARPLLHGHTSLPRVRVFCYGNEVHYFVSFRNHPVFVRVDFAPPLGGGMIDLAYYGVSKFELDAHPALGLEAIQACFRRLDFHVEVESTRIHARYDKERARDLADLCQKAEALFRLVPHLMDVDWIVGGLDLPPDARRVVGRAWADFFARWGVLPAPHVLSADRRHVVVAREPRPEGMQEVYWSGEGAYVDRLTDRPRRGFPGEVHAALARHGFEAARRL